MESFNEHTQHNPSYTTWAQTCESGILLEEYALLCDGKRCETVPNFFYKRTIIRTELLRRLAHFEEEQPA